MTLIKTTLLEQRANYPSNLDRDELRVTSFGMLTAVRAMTTSGSSIVSQDLINKARASQGRDLKIPALRKGTVVIANTRTCTFSSGETESDYVTVVWKTLRGDITMVPSNYENNEIGRQTDFAKKLRELAEAFMIEMENDLDTAMDTNKNQVYDSTIVGDTYALTGNALQVTAANLDHFFNDLDAIDQADDFYQTAVKVISTHRVMSTVRKIEAQGSMNDENTAYQFFNKDFTFSNRVTNGAGVKATGYWMPDGSIGVLTRVDVDARMNHSATDGTQWAEDTIPGLPFPVGIQYKSECDDKSAMQATGTAHLSATLVEHWQISFDFAIIVPYNPDLTTKSSSIRKFEFV